MLKRSLRIIDVCDSSLLIRALALLRTTVIVGRVPGKFCRPSQSCHFFAVCCIGSVSSEPQMRQRHNTLSTEPSTPNTTHSASAYDASSARHSSNPAMYIRQRWGTWKPLAAFLVILAFLNLLVARNFVSAFKNLQTAARYG